MLLSLSVLLFVNFLQAQCFSANSYYSYLCTENVYPGNNGYNVTCENCQTSKDFSSAFKSWFIGTSITLAIGTVVVTGVALLVGASCFMHSAFFKRMLRKNSPAISSDAVTTTIINVAELPEK